MGWPITPDGLRDLLVGLGVTYPDLPPIFITENGVRLRRPAGRRRRPRPRRIAYLDAHLRALHAAIEAGVDVRGYFVWSLLDNFEWAHGYRKRFGIVHVDYDTLERTPRTAPRGTARSSPGTGSHAGSADARPCGRRAGRLAHDELGRELRAPWRGVGLVHQPAQQPHGRGAHLLQRLADRGQRGASPARPRGCRRSRRSEMSLGTRSPASADRP